MVDDKTRESQNTSHKTTELVPCDEMRAPSNHLPRKIYPLTLTMLLTSWISLEESKAESYLMIN